MGVHRPAATRSGLWLRWSAAALGLVLALGIGAGAALALWPGPVVAWLITHVVSTYVQRQITVAGPVEVAWGSPTTLVLHDLVIANTPWGHAPELLRAPVARFEVYFRSLVLRPVHFRLIALDHPTLALERSASGEHNWPTPHHPIPFIETTAIDDGAITFTNDATGKRIAIDARQWRVSSTAGDAPAQIALAGRVGGVPATLAGTIGALEVLREGEAPYPVDLDATLAGEHLTARGTVEHALKADGIDFRIGAGGRAVEALAKALALSLPPLPDFRATAQVKGGHGAWSFSGLRAKLGASDLAGDLAYDANGKRPSLHAKLQARNFDLADVRSYLPQAPAAVPAPGRIIPALPLGDMLNRLDADVAVAARRLVLAPDLVLTDADAAASVAPGALRIEHLSFALAGGSFDGALVVDRAAKPNRARLDITIHRLDLRRLFATLHLSGKLPGAAGIAGGFAHVSGSGDTLPALLGDMNGQVAVYAENGVLPPAVAQLAAYNLFAALHLAAKAPLPVRCLIGGFDIADGIATSRTTVLDAPSTVSVGSGNFNFHDETMTFDVTPLVKQRGALDAYAPVTLRGSFAEPKLGITAGSLPGRLVGSALAALLPFAGPGPAPQDACGRARAAIEEQLQAAAR